MLASCASTVTVPRSDGTAPTVMLCYRIGDTSWEEVTSDETITIGVNETYHLWAVAKDPEGVFLLTMTSRAASAIACVGATEGGAAVTTISELATDIDAFAPGDRADTKRWLFDSIPIYEICDTGTPQGSIRCWAVAENFHGLDAESPVLTLVLE